MSTPASTTSVAPNNLIGPIQIGVGTLPYLLFQFMPAIIIGVFSFMSLMNQDIRAIVYGVGLFFSVGIASLLSRSDSIKTFFGNVPSECRKAFLLTHDTPISIFSLNLIVYAYTFSYLLTGIGMKKSIQENVPVVVFFTCLIAADSIWNFNSCINKNNKNAVGISMAREFIGIILGGMIGWLWALMIYKYMKSPNLLYLVGFGTRETCTATKQKLRCVRRTTS